MKLYFSFFVTLMSCLFCLNSWALPNPASTNCVKQGGKSILKNNLGFCLFSDGTYCEEWAYFRGKCEMGEKKWQGKSNGNNVK